MRSVTISGIIKHRNGYGFKITFNNNEEADRYKDMIRWILKDDGYHIENKKGYYDKLQ